MTKIYTDTEICTALGELAQPDFMATHDKTDGWFTRYNGELANPVAAAKYVRGLRNTLGIKEHENLQGKSVLDVGSGFGLPCLVMKMLGATRVEGIDTFVPMVETAQSYLRAIDQSATVNIQSGLSYDLPFEDNTFDIVMNFEALSHFINQDESVSEAVRVLKPGGTYVIADDNNGANAKIIAENLEIWRRFENGPKGDVHGHTVRLPYVESRKQILQEACPELSDESAEELARLTCYFCRSEIEAAAKRFIENGEKPDSVFDPRKCPVEPNAGQFMENLIDPRVLAASLNTLGCKTKIRAYFGGDGRGGLLKFANQMLNTVLPKNLALRYAPGFKVYATGG
ncbi:MAG: class I SAM-dependent methyltransferase [Pseudomonadota bacterium]